MTVPMSKIMIGCSRVGSLGNMTPFAETRLMLREAVEAGIRGFDTANIYGQGDSERELGRLQAAYPQVELNIVTKAGFRHGRKAEIIQKVKPLLRPLVRLGSVKSKVQQVRAGIDRQCFEPGYLQGCVDGSLERLRLARLPGFLLHDPTEEDLRKLETASFLRSLRSGGKASSVGVSLRDGSGIAAALALAPVDLLQLPVTAYESIRGTGMADEIRDRGIHLSVRQVLRRPDGHVATLNEALPPLLADPLVGAVIIGISKRSNLAELLESAA